MRPILSSILLTTLALCTLSAWSQSRPQGVALPATPILNQTVPAAPQNMRLLPEGQRGKVSQFIEYQDGKLHIVAEDSTLDSVLMAVSQVTGARVEMPAGLQSERIAVSLGPAPMADVIRALLDSSRFNYLILGSPAHPEIIGSIVIKLRNPSAAAQASAATPAANQAGLPAVPVAGQPVTPQAVARQALYQKFLAAQQSQQQQQPLAQQPQAIQQFQQQQLMQQQLLQQQQQQQQLLAQQQQQQQLMLQQQQQQMAQRQEQVQEMGNAPEPQDQQ